MKKVVKRSLVFLLALATLLCASACGKQGDDANQGKYICTSVDFWGDGERLEPDEEIWMEFDKGGKGTMMMYLETEIEWKVNGEDLTVTEWGTDYSGTLKDGVIELDYGGTIYYFVKEGVTAPESAMPVSGDDENDDWGLMPEEEEDPYGEDVDPAQTWEEPLSQEVVDYWDGDWYGWWYVYETTGSWSDFEGNWWDCCAEIELDESGEGSILIWDEDLPKDNALAQVNLQVGEFIDNDAMGVAVSDGGWFLDNGVYSGDWQIVPGSSYYENMLIITGYYEAEDFSFYYDIYLRPWGQLWDDVEADSPEDVPYYYYDWYLPLLEMGEEMPDIIGVATEPQPITDDEAVG